MIKTFVQEVLYEDLGRGDLFERVAQDREAKAKIIAKSEGIFSGEKYLKALCELMGVGLKAYKLDSQSFERGEVLAEIEGSYIEILKLERTSLNMLQHSSGIATHTHTYINALGNLPLKLLDTRKTRPLLREFEKYSVRNGGGHNHRFGLDDALMLKDTHLACIDDLKGFVAQAREKLPFTCKIEVECENLEECKRAFESGVDIVMCDNMTPSAIEQVVALRNSIYPHILLEASGNITLENIREYARSGVDAISSGSLIHQATWVDLSMKMQRE